MGRLANIKHFSTQAYADEVAQDAAKLRKAKISDPQSTRAIQASISRRMQLQFDGALICRTLSSKDANGKPLLDLPPKKVFHVDVQLSEWEREKLDATLTRETFEQ